MELVIELFCILLQYRVSESHVYFMVKAHLHLDCLRCHVWLWLAATLLTSSVRLFTRLSGSPRTKCLSY